VEHSVPRDAGVAHIAVQTAQGVGRLRERGRHLVAVGEVATDRDTWRPGLGGDLGGGLGGEFGLPIDHRHPAPRLSEPAGDGGTDPLGGTGHDDPRHGQTSFGQTRHQAAPS
jgi:hypothetical protein